MPITVKGNLLPYKIISDDAQTYLEELVVVS